MSSIPVYRCPCSWVGSDPDIAHFATELAYATCPACMEHNGTVRRVWPECPKCRATSHRCKTGDCLHCDACGHAWFPKIGRDVSCSTPRHANGKAPDLFKANVACACVRWLVYVGSATFADFREQRIKRGGTTLSTHCFDRYYENVHSSFTSRAGSHGIIRATRKGTARRVQHVTWIGSEGDTFEDRASAWVAKLSPKELDRGLAMFERLLTEALGMRDPDETPEDEEEMQYRVWFQAITAEIAVRTERTVASIGTNAERVVRTKPKRASKGRAYRILSIDAELAMTQYRALA